MRRALVLLLVLVLALPLAATGEGTDMAVDAFIARAGIDADAAMREKIDAFLSARGITESALKAIEDDRLKKYAAHLAEDLPIDYSWMLEADSQPMPEGTSVLQLAVLQPEGAMMESLLADFERGLVYYDSAYPVPEDVCRARYAGALSESDADAMLELLAGMTLEDQAGKITGVELGAIRVAVAWEGGVTRCTAAGEGISEAFLESIWALLGAGRAAARGDDL